MGRQTPVDARVAALEEVWRSHHRRVRWILRARGVHEDALDDLCQEVFLVIHRRLPELGAEVPVDRWVNGIACNVAFSHRRSSARRARHAAEYPRPDVDDPEFEVQRASAWRALQGFLDDMPPVQREVFVLAEILGMTMPEIAEALGVTINTLYSRLRLARARFEHRFVAVAGSDAFATARAAGESTPAQQRRAWGVLVASIAGKTASATATAIWGGLLAVALGGGAVAIATRTEAPAPAASAVLPAAVPEMEPAPTVANADEIRPGTPVATTPAAPTPAPAAPPKPARARDATTRAVDSVDPLGPALAALDEAQIALRRGDPKAALARLDRARAEIDGTELVREALRIERRAACDAGLSERARTAHAALVRAGAAPAAADPCAP